MEIEKRPCVYIIRCSDESLYTGWTNNLEGRIEAHNKGLGAKYTRGRRPVALVYVEYLANKSEAMKREAAIKKYTPMEKKKLLESKSE